MYEFPPFRLDSVNQCLLRTESPGKEERIHLTPKAFAILRHLVENADHLVTHSQLLEVVWPSTFVQPEVLSSHIRDLRAALGDDARKPRFIETLARRGYRFIGKLCSPQNSSSETLSDATGRKLVGRDSPLSKLRNCYRMAIAGRRQLVFVTGEPGIGKTALCLEFLHRIRATEHPPYTAWGQCIEGYGGEEPYFPMLKAIGELCRSGGESVVRIFTLKAPTCIVQFSDLLTSPQRAALEREVLGATSGRMLREVLDALESLALDRPLVLFLDDLQWVDRATVDVIAEFARRREPSRILIVATYRPLEAMLNDNPIKMLKEELLAHRLCSEIPLSPLTESDIAEYLSALSADADLQNNLASLLHRRSEGNPLFMVAALDHSFEQGLMSQDHGHLRLKAPLAEVDLDIPQSLRRMIEAQIDRLTTEEQRILETASVAGIIFSPLVVAATADDDSQHIEDVCHDLARANHIVRAAGLQQIANEAPSSLYEFVHILYREALYDRQAPGRRSMRHQLIGEKLETLYRDHPEDIAAELVYHFEHASDWTRTIKYLRLAAENSERRYAHREAAALLVRALELVDRTPEETRSNAERQILEKLAHLRSIR